MDSADPRFSFATGSAFYSGRRAHAGDEVEELRTPPWGRINSFKLVKLAGSGEGDWLC